MHSKLTVLTAIDANHAERLKHTWPMWMQFRPEFRDIPVLVIHDSRFNPQASALASLLRHPNIRLIPWRMDEAESQRERMITSFLRVAASEVSTEWYLKLDSDVAATRPGPWIDVNWFTADEAGRPPVFIASPWGSTKPADAIAGLDNRRDTVPGFASFNIRQHLPQRRTVE